jgi:hypothetical protein
MPTLSSNNMTAVSWGAIFAGAAAAAALSFILMVLGVGFGLLSISPWSGEGASAEAIGFGTIIWLIIIQLAAAGLGGYLAGRLRVKWPDIHSDEIYFRDTAHGLVTWAVSTLAAVIFMGATTSAVMMGGAKAMSGTADHAEPVVEQMDVDYFANTLLRTRDWDARADQDVRDEVAAIVARSLREDGLQDDDRDYLGDLIAERTELSSSEARQRVDDVYARAEANLEAAVEMADEARQAAAWTAIWMFVALLAGAFFAALMATFGGRQRDSVFNADV